MSNTIYAQSRSLDSMYHDVADFFYQNQSCEDIFERIDTCIKSLSEPDLIEKAILFKAQIEDFLSVNEFH